MAFLAALKRLRLYKPHTVILFPQTSRRLDNQLFLSRFFSEAFCQTPSRLFTHQANSGKLHHAYGQYIPQIMNFDEYEDPGLGNSSLGFPEFLDRTRKAKEIASGDEAMAFLDDSGVKPDRDFVVSLIWALREEWKLAFLVFKWGQKWDCVVEKTWCLIVWVLGNHKKFSTAWTLIQELYRGSKDAQQAMMIMIDRYVAANSIDKAIETFHMMQKFKFSHDQSTYFIFLNILCKYGNLEEAEQFMFSNKKFYPLETESFNIILNGWCKITVNIAAAKRVWREMSKCCIEPNGTSFTLLISCHSKVGNLFESLRLYDDMKKRNWVPGVDVYHSLIYVLTHENCSSEALKIVDRMKGVGLVPNSTTYNCMILPLCESKKFEEARTILSQMVADGVSPNIDTYHALLDGENIEGTLGVINHMKRSSLGPNRDTFIRVLGKFLKLDQPENALAIWSEMKQCSVKPDRGLYSILVEGLAKHGLIVIARELYSEMISIGLGDDPFLKKLIQEPVQEVTKEKEQISAVKHAKKGKGVQFGKTSARTTGRTEQGEKKKSSRT